MKSLRSSRATLALALALASAAVALTSCKSALLRPPHWAVEVSPMDYVQFLCGEESTTNSVTEGLLKLELLGTGYLTCWAGRSPRVKNEFWQQQDNPIWEEYESDSVHVSAAYVRSCFQHLVDTGFFEPKYDKLTDKQVSPKGILVVAAINGRKQAAVVDDPRVAASVRELLKQF